MVELYNYLFRQVNHILLIIINILLISDVIPIKFEIHGGDILRREFKILEAYKNIQTWQITHFYP